MNIDSIYNDFLHDVYERIDVQTIYKWTKADRSDKKGILQRIDYAWGEQFNYKDDGTLSNTPNLFKDSARIGLLSIIKDCAKKYGKKLTTQELYKNFLNQIEVSCSTIKGATLCFLIGNYKKCTELASTQLNIMLTESRLEHMTMKKGTYTYRMRNRKEGQFFSSALDIFHAPFNLRNILKTYRYSVPGYPCLYVADSLYSCWEEMRRPNLDGFFYVGFRNLEDVKLLDLRVRRDLTTKKEIEIYLQMLPWTIACSMQVKESGDVFVPEYIIPQEIFKWLLKKYRNDRKNALTNPCMGIAYTSAMEDVWFEFTKNPSDYHLADNMALLTYVPKELVLADAGYCPYLSGIFETTRPHCYEYEYIKNSAEFFNKAFKREHYSADEVKNYKNSYLSFLEDRLKSCDEWTRVVNVINKRNK